MSDPLAQKARDIASFLSERDAELLRQVASGKQPLDVPGCIALQLRDLQDIELVSWAPERGADDVDGVTATQLGIAVTELRPPRAVSGFQPAAFSLPVSLSANAVLSMLWDCVPTELDHPWCVIDSWHIPAGADWSWIQPLYPVLRPEVGKLLDEYGYCNGWIHEAAAAMLLGGWTRFRIKAPGHRYDTGVFTLDRDAINRGLRWLGDETLDHIDDLTEYVAGDEFLQQCLFGEIVFPAADPGAAES